jgi:hypothetical protein
LETHTKTADIANAAWNSVKGNRTKRIESASKVDRQPDCRLDLGQKEDRKRRTGQRTPDP